jgi:hypothetical protein
MMNTRIRRVREWVNSWRYFWSKFTPLLIPHHCERLQGLKRNHSPVSPGINTGELTIALNRERKLLPQMGNISVQVSKELIHLLRSISQPDNFIS